MKTVYDVLKWVQLERDMADAYAFFLPIFRRSEQRHRHTGAMARLTADTARHIASFLVLPGLDFHSLHMVVRSCWCCGCCCGGAAAIRARTASIMENYGSGIRVVDESYQQRLMEIGWYSLCIVYGDCLHTVQRVFGLKYQQPEDAQVVSNGNAPHANRNLIHHEFALLRPHSTYYVAPVKPSRCLGFCIVS